MVMVVLWWLLRWDLCKSQVGTKSGHKVHLVSNSSSFLYKHHWGDHIESKGIVTVRQHWCELIQDDVPWWVGSWLDFTWAVYVLVQIIFWVMTSSHLANCPSGFLNFISQSILHLFCTSVIEATALRARASWQSVSIHVNSSRAMHRGELILSNDRPQAILLTVLLGSWIS